MSEIFCCPSLKPYKPKNVDHEPKFSTFMKWASIPASTTSNTVSDTAVPLLDSSTYVVQIVRQKNFGALEWKRYFKSVGASGAKGDFLEITEQDIIDANFEKLNSYKNFKCGIHNLFFEVNIYQKNPVNLHHWRANVARPASSIDLPTKSASETTASTTSASAGIPSNAVKEESGAVENMSLGQGTTPKQESDTKAQRDGVLQPVNIERRELVVEDPGYFDDDYYDRRGQSWDRSPSPSAGGDDFTACSADDCGYCGRCSY